MDIFSKRLREERENNNLTQKQMAEKLGIPFRTYAHYEQKSSSGREPHFELLVRIADILETTTDYLLGRTNI